MQPVARGASSLGASANSRRGTFIRPRRAEPAERKEDEATEGRKEEEGKNIKG